MINLLKKLFRRAKRDEIIPTKMSPIAQEYYRLYHAIRGASTKSELAGIEDQITLFDVDFKSRADVHEWYIDLLGELQIRYNELSIKNIQYGIS